MGKKSCFSNILLTGATGVLGAQILKVLLNETVSIINLIIRAKNQKQAQKRGLVLMRSIGCEKFLDRIVVLRGDLSDRDLGLNKFNYSKLASKINSIYHCAAATDFRISKKEAIKSNIDTTRNILSLANNSKVIEKFNYIGTAFIAGNHDGRFSERDFDVDQRFGNYYEYSKFEAEKLVRKNVNNKFCYLIFRPSVIMGSYKDGKINKFKMIYEPMRIFSKGILKEVPANRQTIHNFIPVDVAAKAIFVLSKNVEENNVFHIMSPNNSHCGKFLDLAAIFFNFRNPKFIPIEKFDFKEITFVQKRMVEPYIHYFNFKCIFCSEHTREVLGRYNFFYPRINNRYFLEIFSYCHNAGYITKADKI
ncbi:MAG: SDR family oxidoreductase [Candidatus Aceula meridiana]|nr:SDR family oxidoreductase [Candidatus Aceula meridiana]